MMAMVDRATTTSGPDQPDLSLAETAANQRLATDPSVSAWVSANAGTGKTYVLSRRVLRLLLAGTEPERILCLTFTKAAAAEMSKRVFELLAQWVTASDAQLVASLENLLGRAATPVEAGRARQLFARAIETPGGLKVQTIHAFAERLLKRFPLEAGVAPHFSTLDDASARELLREAIDGTLSAAARDKSGRLWAALEIVIPHAAEDGFDQILGLALSKLDRRDAALLDPAQNEALLAAIEHRLRAAFSVRPDVDQAGIMAEMATVFRQDMLPALAAALRSGGTTDNERASEIQMATAAVSAPLRAGALQGFFMTGGGAPRARLMTKAVSDKRPDLAQITALTQARFVALHEEYKAAGAISASMGLTVLATDVLGRYEAGKAARAALDYGDLIARTASLLEGSTQAQWVLFKLDGGLDHILVDEAQDTSGTQWRIVQRLAEEFYSGAGARASTLANGDTALKRTMFAVGDEKQSIYGFQGAKPKLFAAMGRFFAAQAQRAHIALHRLPLNRSFRTVAPVLEAVDAVFGGANRPAGVTTGDQPIQHVAHRARDAGLVEIWDTEKPQDAEGSEAWSPLDETHSSATHTRLADQIATTIRTWLDRGDVLESEGRPIRARDVLILVRKRTPFAEPMIRALKARGVDVAGADRMRIAEELVVMDLLVLADFLLLPEDDLALATVLKCPLFGLDDEHLFQLANGRRGTLWNALLKAAKTDARYQAAAKELRRWRSLVDYAPPFEFFAAILDHDGGFGTGRWRLLSRVGAEGADALDEFLNLALAYDSREQPSLQGFVEWIRTAGAEVKRDAGRDRDEVRVMTVHGAKGLEAPIVFLADTCSAKSNAFGQRVLEIERDDDRSDGRSPLIVWAVKGTSTLTAVETAKQAITASDREEYHRLLYVAMTRARDRLYVTGFEGKRGRDAGCWYDLIANAVRPGMAQLTQPDGRMVWRLETNQPNPSDSQAPSRRVLRPMPPLPAWTGRDAPREQARAVPVAPSRLAPLDIDAGGASADDWDETVSMVTVAHAEPARAEPAAQPILRPSTLAADHRFLRGELTHALLEHLPGVADKGRRSIARAFVERRGSVLSERARKSIVDEVLAILNNSGFVPLFSPAARAEVPIAAEIPSPDGTGAPLRITGQIDRLAVTEHEILIVDYKTNRPPPLAPAAVAQTYLQQLAAYRLAVRAIYHDLPVRAALLWTDGPRLMEIPPELLDEHERRLWTRPAKS